MNPLAISAAAALNFAAMFIIASFVLKWLIVLLPAGPVRDGLAALVL